MIWWLQPGSFSSNLYWLEWIQISVFYRCWHWQGAAAHRNLRAFKELARHPNTSPQWIETRKKWLVSWELCSISHVLTQAAHTSQQKATTITTQSLHNHLTKNRDRKMFGFMRESGPWPIWGQRSKYKILKYMKIQAHLKWSLVPCYR